MRVCATTMKKDAETERRPLVPPDGGWGWMVVLGVAISNAVTQALLSVFGLLFAETLENMGVATTGAAIICNVMVAVTNFSGLVIGPSMRHFSVRKVAMAGGILTAVGMTLTSLATTMLHLIITYSILVGLGLGLLSPSTFVAVNSYFVRSRGRAVGLGMAGTGLGQLVMPQAVRMLLDEYSFSGTALILGAVALNSLVGASLFQPVRWHSREAPSSEDERAPLQKAANPKRNTSALSLCSEEVAIVVMDVSKECRGKQNKMTLEKSASDKVISEKAALEKTEKEKIALEKPEGREGPVVKVINHKVSVLSSCWAKTVSIFDLDLLRDPSFVSLVIGLAAVYTAGINFGMVFPFFLASVGLERSEIAFCMSILAGADIFCRLSLPWITDRARLSSRVVFLVGSLGLAATRSLLAGQKELNWLLAISALCGLVRGSTTVNLNLSISESCSPEKLPAALGINMVLKGISILVIGPFIGWFRDETGSYPLCMHALSVMIVIPMMVWLVELVIKRRRGR